MAQAAPWMKPLGRQRPWGMNRPRGGASGRRWNGLLSTSVESQGFQGESAAAPEGEQARLELLAFQ